MSEQDLTVSDRRPTHRAKSRNLRKWRLAKQIRDANPHLDDPRFAPEVDSFAILTLLVIDGCNFLREKGLVGADGELRSSVDTVQRLIGTQLRLAKELHLTPASVRSMKGERPIDLAAAIAEADDADAR